MKDTWYLEFEVEELREVVSCKLKATDKDGAMIEGRKIYQDTVARNSGWSHRDPVIVCVGVGFRFTHDLELAP